MTSISDKVAAAWDALVAVYTLTETYSHSQDAKEAWANKAYWARIIASDIRRGKSFVSILALWNSVDDGYGILIAENEAAETAAYTGSDEEKIAHFAGRMAKGLQNSASDVHKRGDKQLQPIQKALERTAQAWEEIEKEAAQLPYYLFVLFCCTLVFSKTVRIRRRYHSPFLATQLHGTIHA